ncbi:hypothetical protein TNCV_4903821 [Trichonephila clavipes]|nr:hypothetical protein TNCV_4903821 [Trichonephila clavipes]
MKIGNNGNLDLGPFDESTPCLMIVLMNRQTKLRINHLTAVKSVAILEKMEHMEEVIEDEDFAIVYYLPHHGMYRHESKTTPLRVVLMHPQLLLQGNRQSLYN